MEIPWDNRHQPCYGNLYHGNQSIRDLNNFFVLSCIEFKFSMEESWDDSAIFFAAMVTRFP